MKIRYIPVISVLGILTLLSSCAKEGPTGPTGIAGPSFTGSVVGYVSLYDQYGNKVLHGYDSVYILLTPNTTVIPSDTTINPSNINGYYDYNYVTTGNYYITASYVDTVYGATEINNFQYLSGTLNKDIKMSAVPTFSVTVTSLHNTGSVNDSLVISCAADVYARSIVIFANDFLPVDNTPDDYLISMVKTIPAYATQVSVLVPAQALYDANFVSGTMVYYAVYSGAVNDYSAYEDLNTGKTIYNSVSNPYVDSAVTP